MSNGSSATVNELCLWASLDPEDPGAPEECDNREDARREPFEAKNPPGFGVDATRLAARLVVDVELDGFGPGGTDADIRFEYANADGLDEEEFPFE